MNSIEQWDKLPENQVSKLITIADTLIDSSEQLGNVTYWLSNLGEIGLEAAVRSEGTAKLFLLQSDSHFICGSIDEDGKRSRDYFRSMSNPLHQLSFAINPRTVEENPNSPLTPTLDIIHSTNSPEYIMALNLSSKFVVPGGTRSNPNCLFFVMNTEDSSKNNIFVNFNKETLEIGTHMTPKNFSTITQYASKNDAAMILESSSRKILDLVGSNTLITLKNFMEIKKVENQESIYSSLFVTLGGILHEMLESVETI